MGMDICFYNQHWSAKMLGLTLVRYQDEIHIVYHIIQSITTLHIIYEEILDCSHLKLWQTDIHFLGADNYNVQEIVEKQYIILMLQNDPQPIHGKYKQIRCCDMKCLQVPCNYDTICSHQDFIHISWAQEPAFQGFIQIICIYI